MVVVQVPSVGEQHVPDGGCGQGVRPSAPHVCPTVQLLADEQFTCVTVAQMPVLGLQHVPVGGCGHGARPSGPHTCPWVQLLPVGH